MIGAVVFSTTQGLGYLAKDFHDNGLLDKVLIFPHSNRPSNPEWFKNQRPFSEQNISWLLEDLKVLLIFETAFDLRVVRAAKQMGIKVVLIPMYECTPYPLPYSPDIILTPSALDTQYFEEGRGVVIPSQSKFRLREKAKVFVHNSGNGGLGGRNGTREVLEAMKYVTSPIKLIVRQQEGSLSSNDPRIEFQRSVPRETLYDEGDVFLFPEKFNGLSMPLQEAFSAGMLIMCGKRFPMTEWLPLDPMIPVKSYHKEMIAREIDVADYDPKVIASVIDYWYDKDISEFSKMGRKWAKKNTWANFTNTFIQLCDL